MHPDPYVEAEADVGEANNCNDDPVESHDMFTTFPISEGSVEDDDFQTVLAPLDAVASVKTKDGEDSMHGNITLWT